MIMARVAASLAKLAGIRKALDVTLNDDHKKAGRLPIQNFSVEEVGRYFSGAAAQLVILREELPDLFADFVEMPLIPKIEMAKTTPQAQATYRYGRGQLE